MSKIILAYNNPKLKVGDKIEVLTITDHHKQGSYARTSAWSMNAEAKYANRTYTVTEKVLQALQNHQNITMYEFPECPNDNWIMHYADFKMAKTIEIVETPIYQILKITEDKISNVLLTPDKEQAEKLLKAILERNTDPKTKFTKIEFTLKKKIEKEYE